MALLFGATRGHIDDIDSQLYGFLARQMAAAGQWLEPGLPPGSSLPFREHLPFGLWPSALAARAGRGAMTALQILFSVLTVCLTSWMALRRFGRTAAIASGLVLALTETFFVYGGRTRLDPLLVLLTTASAAVVLVRPAWRAGWALAVALASAAALVKGPFGVVPLGAAWVAIALAERRPAALLIGLGSATLALLPVSLFLAHNLLMGDGSWRRYVLDQLLASAQGTRTDGVLDWYFPFVTLAGRFWPGLLLVALAVVAWARPGPHRSSEERRNFQLFALFVLFTTLALCLPSRKVWNHALIVYPGLAVLAGAGALAIEQRWPRVMSVALGPRVLLPLLATSFVLAATGQVGRTFLQPPCPFTQELSAALQAISRDRPLPVVGPHAYRAAVMLADEQARATTVELTLPPDASSAVAESGPDIDVTGWRTIAEAQGWRVLERDSTQSARSLQGSSARALACVPRYANDATVAEPRVRWSKADPSGRPTATLRRASALRETARAVVQDPAAKAGTAVSHRASCQAAAPPRQPRAPIRAPVSADRAIGCVRGWHTGPTSGAREIPRTRQNVKSLRALPLAGPGSPDWPGG
jgi:hypothetical protein